MKIDWRQNPEYLAAAASALGFESFGNAHHLSVVDSQGELALIWVYHNFAEMNCEITVVSFQPAVYTPRILSSLFAYPFFQLGLRRVTAVIRADNQRSLEQTRRMGFRVEGLLRNWYPDCHGILHGLLREECKWVANLKPQPRPIP